MKYFLTLLFTLQFLMVSLAQDLPLKIEIPALSTDPNMKFTVLHFDVLDKDKFTVFYYHIIYGSVIHSGEFVSDTGQYVFKDPKRRVAIVNSNAVVLLKKQTFNASGKILSEDEWILAQRSLESTGEYKLYYAKGFKHAAVPNRVVITNSIYNLDAVKGLSNEEMSALVALSKTMIPLPTGDYETVAARKSTFAEDLLATKKQFKSLRSTGLLFKGDLPSGESVLTRYNIVSDRTFVITKIKDKSKPGLLKFYVTEDYKTFDCLDSARVDGDVTLTSAATIYNTNSEAIGAFANLFVKSKDAKGEELNQQFSVAMDANYTIGTWMHSVGKNKLNSLSPEVCWYEGNKLWVMSNNREKFFKSYLQMHLFEKGQAAVSVFPLNDEEKGSEKSKFVKTYQPTPANGVGIAPPLAERYIPIYFTTSGETRYIIMQGTRMDETTHNRQYLSVNIYRIDEKGKVTHVDMLGDYKGFVPLPLPQLVKNPTTEYFLLPYPVKLQLAFYGDRCDISPLDVDNSSLVAKPNQEYLAASGSGAALLRRTNMGTKYTLLFYQKQ